MKSDVNEITKACQGEGARVSEDPGQGRAGQGRIGQDSMGEQRVRMGLFISAAYRSMMGYGSGPSGGTVGIVGCLSQAVWLWVPTSLCHPPVLV